MKLGKLSTNNRINVDLISNIKLPTFGLDLSLNNTRPVTISLYNQCTTHLEYTLVSLCELPLS